jgi:hemerythrin-like domain-containing protein
MREGELRSVTRMIAADPGTIYRLVSDVTRTGEWSPETRSARWIGGATGPVAGAKFRGMNRWRLVIWARTCVVEEAEPGKRFVFRTLPAPGLPDSTRWSYEFEDVAGGTRVTESYEILRALPAWLQSTAGAALLPHHQDMRPHMAETLARLEIGAGLFAGQAAAPPGPVDVTAMYLMHHAFRRDLRDFAHAVSTTALPARDTWVALRDRWDRFAEVLHKHHTAEDDGLWPLLRARAVEAGDDSAVATLDAMAAEHAGIDPLLEAIRDGFAALVDDPADAARAGLGYRLSTAIQLLGAHLAHEERDAMALAQVHLSQEDWHRVEKDHFRAAYRPKDLPFVLAWTLKGLPPAGRRRAQAIGGLPMRILAFFVEPIFRRREKAAFG